MKENILLFMMLIFAGPGAGAAGVEAEVGAGLLPIPQHVGGGKTFPVSSANVTFELPGKPVKSTALAVKMLEEKIAEISGDAADAKPIRIFLGQIGDAIFAPFKLDASAVAGKPEGYCLRFAEDDESVKILAAGNDNRGVFWAAMTVLQMLEKPADGPVLRCAEVDDWPQWRERYLSDYSPVSSDFLIRNVLRFKSNGYGFQQRGVWDTIGPEQKPKYGRSATWREGLAEMKKLRDETGLIDYMFVHNIYAGKPTDSFNIADEADVEKLIEQCRFMLEYGVDHLQIGVDDFISTSEGKYVFHHPEEKARFGNVGRAHGYLMRRLYAALKPKYPQAVLSFCPTPYSLHGHRAARDPGREYLAELARVMPDDVYVVWTGPSIVSLEVGKKDFVDYAGLVRPQPLYIWHNPRDIRGLMPYLPRLKFYQGFETDMHGIFFMNSHSGMGPYQPSSAVYAAASWNLPGMDLSAARETAFRRVWRIKNYAPIDKIVEGMKKLENIHDRDERRGELEALQSLVADVQQGQPDLPLRRAQGYLEKELSLVNRERITVEIPRPPLPEPVVDGRLNEELWTKATVVDLVNPDGSRDGNFATRALLARGRRGLYLAFLMKDVEDFSPVKLKRDQLEKSAADFISLYFVPPQKTQRYALYSFDLSGNISDSYLWGKPWDPRWRVAVKKKTSYWAAEVVIPFASFSEVVLYRQQVPANSKWQIQLCRTVRREGKTISKCFSPTGEDAVSTRGCFAEAILK